MASSKESLVDSIIVGGGAAGLMAATILARARRNVLVLDERDQSNAVSPASHGVFTRDGTSPEELYKIAREQLLHYSTVQILDAEVTEVKKEETGFIVTSASGKVWHSRSILFAQGMSYTLPDIPGLRELWGEKVWHCPYCDGYEARDKKVLLIGGTEWLEHMSVLLPQWTPHLTVSPTETLNRETKERFERTGAQIIQKVQRVEKQNSGVLATLSDGSIREVDGVFVDATLLQRDALSRSLGCLYTPDGYIQTDERGATSIAGVYVAGDQTQHGGQVNLAAAMGHHAAMHINMYLAEIDRGNEASQK